MPAARHPHSHLLVPHFTTTTAGGTRERKGRAKTRKIWEQYKGCLTNEGGGEEHCTTSHKQTDAQSVSRQQPPWKPKNPLLPLPQFLLLSMVLHGMQFPSGQLGSAFPAVSPPYFSPTSSLLTRARAE